MNWIKKIKLNVKAFRSLLGKEKDLMSVQQSDTQLKNNTLENVKLVDSSLGNYSYVSNNSIIYNCQIGKFCSIGPNVVIGFGEHPIDFLSTSPLFYASKNGMFGTNLFTENEFKYKEPVTIGNDVWIGANVYVKNGVTIGDGAVVGAGAVVTKSIPPYAIAVGVPAKIIRYRFSEEVVGKLLKEKWWDWNLEKIKTNKHYFTTENFEELLNSSNE